MSSWIVIRLKVRPEEEGLKTILKSQLTIFTVYLPQKFLY